MLILKLYETLILDGGGSGLKLTGQNYEQKMFLNKTGSLPLSYLPTPKEFSFLLVKRCAVREWLNAARELSMRAGLRALLFEIWIDIILSNSFSNIEFSNTCLET